MLVKFTRRNAINLAVLVVAVLVAATISAYDDLAPSTVIIVGILSVAVMKVFWVSLDNLREMKEILHRDRTDHEAAMDYLLRKREQIAECGQELAGR